MSEGVLRGPKEICRYNFSLNKWEELVFNKCSGEYSL